MKFIVQQWDLSPNESHLGWSAGRWTDICAPTTNPSDPSWEAGDAGHAFNMAVLRNPDHKLQSTTYRVLPYSGGATFNVGVNLDATDHNSADTTDTTDTTVERKGA